MLCRSNMIISSKQQKTTKTYFHFKCLSANIEAVKKQLDAIKAQKDKDEKEFKEEIKSQMDSAASAKCQLGMISFEKEQEIIKYKRYIKKLQAKLIGFGVVFGKKKTQK